MALDTRIDRARALTIVWLVALSARHRSVFFILKEAGEDIFSHVRLDVHVAVQAGRA
jgi:hypothetical protein